MAALQCAGVAEAVVGSPTRPQQAVTAIPLHGSRTSDEATMINLHFPFSVALRVPLISLGIAVALLSAPDAQGQRTSDATKGDNGELTTLGVPRRVEPVFSARGHNLVTCDGSKVRSVTSTRATGKAIQNLGLLVSLLGTLPIWPERQEAFGEVVTDRSVSIPVMFGGLGVAAVGWFMALGSSAHEPHWENAMKSLNIGTTTARETTECLGTPSASRNIQTGDGNLTEFEYRADFGSSHQNYKLTFRQGVLAGIERAQTGKP